MARSASAYLTRGPTRRCQLTRAPELHLHLLEQPPGVLHGAVGSLTDLSLVKKHIIIPEVPALTPARQSTPSTRAAELYPSRDAPTKACGNSCARAACAACAPEDLDDEQRAASCPITCAEH